jgi:antitoxin component of MazEF toxin-antitoxin module
MPHEEVRKIVRIGNSSLAIILPKSWLRYNKLHAKDKVKVISDGSVVIEPLTDKENVS